MANITWAEMFYLVSDKLAMEINALPKEVVTSHIQRAAAYVARESQSLIRVIDIDVQRGVSQYPIELGDDLVFYRLLALDQRCGHRLSGREVDRCSGYEPYRIMDNGWLDVGYCPDRDERRGLSARVAAFPGSKACGVDEHWFEMASETISARVMAEVYKQDGPLYNPASQSKEQREVAKGIRHLSHNLRDGGNATQTRETDRGRYARRLR